MQLLRYANPIYSYLCDIFRSILVFIAQTAFDKSPKSEGRVLCRLPAEGSVSLIFVINSNPSSSNTFPPSQCTWSARKSPEVSAHGRRHWNNLLIHFCSAFRSLSAVYGWGRLELFSLSTNALFRIRAHDFPRRNFISVLGRWSLYF